MPKKGKLSSYISPLVFLVTRDYLIVPLLEVDRDLLPGLLYHPRLLSRPNITLPAKENHLHSECYLGDATLHSRQSSGFVRV
ncbi:unnamed protein product [Bursaphelenchus xylophilus]|uniref:(pine wood nematode) hypothetical protein n=1 Tax=Bursaphelenchus xylophilus TaxID=6326 RepID=A0A811K8T4_BURXY|nr:unnamed protein product [Bursaphelenchus xylophilus]CAG9089384.1 unnamed protein product [Bursaphelenchus xylophilus]